MTRSNPASTALLTDRYELTMLQAALRSGAAGRRCVFEVFARRLPRGRRYGVVVGTGRLLDALENFRFDDGDLASLVDNAGDWDLSMPSGIADDGTIVGTGSLDLHLHGYILVPLTPLHR